MTDPIFLNIVHRQSLTGVDITDDHIRAIVERANAMGLTFVVQPKQMGKARLLQMMKEANGIPNQADMVPSQWASAAASAGATPVEFDKPAAPADDEATVQAMRREIAPYSDEWENIATDLIAAIRRGEVPGLTTIDGDAERARFERWYADAVAEYDKTKAERDALKVEVERLKAELNRQGQGQHEARERFKAEIAAAHVARNASTEGYRDTIKEIAAERDAAIARAEKAEAENKTLEQGMNHNADIANTARAAHAEAMKLLRKMDAGLPYVVRDPDVLKPLAKYSKDASK